MSEETRGTLFIGLWFLSAVVLAALFISAAAQGELTPGHMVLAFVVLALAVAGTLFVSSQKNAEVQETKAKRRRLDNLLHNLDDDDIAELKRRLLDVDDRETLLSDYVGDDGELNLRR